MKATQKDFTSVVGLLMKAGHVGMRVNLERSVGQIFKRRADYVWFPTLRVVVSVDSNSIVQVRRDGEGGWYFRRNRKNAWYNLSDINGGKAFVDLVEPHYVKFINDTMLGDADVPNPKGRSVQSGDSPQAT